MDSEKNKSYLKAKKSHDFVVRCAVLSDAAILRRWDEKPHIKRAVSDSGTSSFEADWDKELAIRSDGTQFFIAEVKGRPIGAMQIIDPATEQSHYWGAVATNLSAIDIWIGEEAWIGQGFGQIMMEFAIRHSFADDRVSAILVDPLSNNKRAHTFYERFGFQYVERRQFDDESDCFVFKLSRASWGEQ